jgi:hypothetical protein
MDTSRRVRPNLYSACDARDLCVLLAVVAIVAALLMGGCNPNMMPGDDGLPAGSARQTVTAASGGTLTGSTGIRLEIPPGALDEDVQITVMPIDADDLRFINEGFIVGVRFEPQGLQFARPATLRIPLPAPWPAGDPPIEFEFAGDDPNQAIDTGLLVRLSDDRREAIVEVRHFSGKICANQCHAGVKESLAERFADRGCFSTNWTRRVAGKYPGIKVDVDDCQFISPGEIHAILDTFLEDYGGWDEGEDVPADDIETLLALADEGHQIVFMFGKGQVEPRSGERRFYGNVAHTAIAERVNGEWMIRNALLIANEENHLLQVLGGTNLVWWPMRDLNGFRNALQGVPAEMQVCGAPGCLASEDGLFQDNPLLPLEKRFAPWTAVRIFFERFENAPCSRLAGCWEFSFTEGDETSTYLVKFDPIGRVDSLWLKASPEDFADEDTASLLPPAVYAEFLRFIAPNAVFLAESVENVHQAVYPFDDQSEFAASFGLEFVDSSGGETTRTKYEFSILDAHLTTNEPDEAFAADFRQTVTTTIIGEDGAPDESTEELFPTIIAKRVPCPSEDDGTAIPQEDLLASFADFLDDLDVCGAGMAGTMPLMLAGLVGVKLSRRRAR